MTEPAARRPHNVHHLRGARRDDWVITSGRKFFSSNARTPKFVIVMAVTNPDVSPYKGMSMFLVPSDTPGVRIERHLGIMGEATDEGMHALIAYDGVRVPADALLGGEGQAFAIAQTRLGGGRVHHAMRVVGQSQKALDMMAERALSRETQGERLADKQLVRADLADSYAQLAQFRLFVLYTAWQIDRYQDYKRVRKDIAAIKFLTPKVLHDIVYRSMHLHGALRGLELRCRSRTCGTAPPSWPSSTRPTEVHKITVARDVLRGYEAAPGPVAPPSTCPPAANGPGSSWRTCCDARQHGIPRPLAGRPGHRPRRTRRDVVHLRGHLQRHLRHPARRAEHGAAQAAGEGSAGAQRDHAP
ncbi:acyl-CoA dehydrogenase family protein [Streptomyces sp. L7]